MSLLVIAAIVVVGLVAVIAVAALWDDVTNSRRRAGKRDLPGEKSPSAPPAPPPPPELPEIVPDSPPPKLFTHSVTKVEMPPEVIELVRAGRIEEAAARLGEVKGLDKAVAGKMMQAMISFQGGKGSFAHTLVSKVTFDAKFEIGGRPHTVSPAILALIKAGQTDEAAQRLAADTGMAISDARRMVRTVGAMGDEGTT